MSDRPELIVRAALFTTEGDFDGAMAAVAEQADGSGFALHFLRARAFDEGDRAQGTNTYCVTTNEGNTEYGAIVDWDRGPRHLDLEMHPDAARRLHVPERFRLLLRADRMSNERFLEGIATILDAPEE
ncbi:MAG: Imm10 family immunity protein [Myxococcota bacterium]